MSRAVPNLAFDGNVPSTFTLQLCKMFLIERIGTLIQFWVSMTCKRAHSITTKVKSGRARVRRCASNYDSTHSTFQCSCLEVSFDACSKHRWNVRSSCSSSKSNASYSAMYSRTRTSRENHRLPSIVRSTATNGSKETASPHKGRGSRKYKLSKYVKFVIH